MTLNEYIEAIENADNRTIFKGLLEWTQKKYPSLDLEFKWNQPMFIDHGTFIISYSVAKNHISIAPEKLILDEYLDEITESGYTYSKKLFRIKFTDKVNYKLLQNIIERSIVVKKEYNKFWL